MNTKMEGGSGSYPFIDDAYSQNCVFVGLSISANASRNGTLILKNTKTGIGRPTTYTASTFNSESTLVPRYIDHQGGALMLSGVSFTGGSASTAAEIIRVGASVGRAGLVFAGYTGNRDVVVVNDLRQSPRLYSKGVVSPSLVGVNTTGTAGYVNNLPYINFDPTTEQEARFAVVVPGDAIPGSRARVVLTYYSNTIGGAVVWRVATNDSLSPDAALNGSVATAATNYDAPAHTPGNAQKIQRVSVLAGGVRPGDLLGFRVIRVAGDAADTLADNARIVGVTVQYEREF
ncbi:hypothetical protein [Arthrobacter burdickii]|uniref:Uncharacterized protein n=1 Tax=Arthrobacter burdickii TaxID=3035920 RepID=A0ABT8K1V8_9MICC|nr:hypothetical protein [Arthrobacter burdickii]MDN4611062.1 hypothetical protein [Arthrobacter burdickii]